MATDLEQYKIVISMWDNEITRFYSRQNLYVGIQLAAFAGVMAGIEALLRYPGLVRLALGFLLIFGFLTALIATRGLTTQKLSLKIIAEIEGRNKDLDILALTQKHTKVNVLTNFMLSVVFSWLFVILWVSVWIYFESSLL